MRIEGNRVTFSGAELSRFAERWPCFGHRPESLQLVFSRGEVTELEGDAGVDPGAILAIAGDAKAELARYGRAELRAALDRQRRADADSAWLIDEAQAERGRAALEAAGISPGQEEPKIWDALLQLDRIGVEL